MKLGWDKSIINYIVIQVWRHNLWGQWFCDDSGTKSLTMGVVNKKSTNIYVKSLWKKPTKGCRPIK